MIKRMMGRFWDVWYDWGVGVCGRAGFGSLLLVCIGE